MNGYKEITVTGDTEVTIGGDAVTVLAVKNTSGIGAEITITNGKNGQVVILAAAEDGSSVSIAHSREILAGHLAVLSRVRGSWISTQ